jgi:AraC-like DNA-binding protein
VENEERDFEISRILGREGAEATGFADQSHFTKVFRRMVGVTPKQFRE